MRRSRTLPVVLLLSATALAACSNQPANTAQKSPGGSPSATASGTTSGSPSATGSPTASTSPAGQPSGSPSRHPSTTPASPTGTHTTGPRLPSVRIEAANLHVAVLGRSAARTAEEKAVVAAWMQYWHGASDTYYYYKPTASFTRVARGQARTAILTYLETVKAKDERVVGWARDNITRVQVTGDTATVRDCVKNFTFRVDQESEPVSRATPYYDMTGALTKEQGRWVVTEERSKNLMKSCLS